MTAGKSWIPTGTIHPTGSVSVAYARLIPAPQRFPPVTSTVMEPVMNPLRPAGEISEQYAGAAFSTIPIPR